MDCRNDRLTREAESESESYVLAVTDAAAASIRDGDDAADAEVPQTINGPAAATG